MRLILRMYECMSHFFFFCNTGKTVKYKIYLLYFYGLLSSPEENEVVLLEWPMAAGMVW